MKRNQTGFALIDTILIILIVIVAVAGGYGVWHNQKNKPVSSASSPATSKGATSNSEKQYSMAGGKILFNLPLAWSVVDQQVGQWGNTCYWTVYTNSDFVKCIEGKAAYPSALGSDSGFAVYISAYTAVAGHSDPASWFEHDFYNVIVQNDSNDTVSNNEISGHSAFHWEQRDPSYTDEHYVLSQSGQIVYVYSRIKSDSTNFSNYLPGIKSLVDSVTFK